MINLLCSIKSSSLAGWCFIALLFGISSSVYASKTGKQVFKTYCIACHMNGVAGAPKFGNAADWEPRIAKGMDTLLKDATSGIKAMPPKGLCFECSEDELTLAIQYMIDNSQK